MVTFVLLTHEPAQKKEYQLHEINLQEGIAVCPICKGKVFRDNSIDEIMTKLRGIPTSSKIWRCQLNQEHEFGVR